MVTEAVVIASVTFLMIKKINGVKAEVDQLKGMVMSQDQRLLEAMKHIKHLYDIIDQLGRRSQPIQSVSQPSVQPVVQSVAQPITPTMSSQPSLSQSVELPPLVPPQQQLQQQIYASQAAQQAQMQAQMFHQAQQVQMQTQQQPQRRPAGVNMLDTILNIVPAMMGPMMSSNTHTMIINELEKTPKPNVEIINEEDDPDVLAVFEGSTEGTKLPTILEEDA